MEIQKYLLLQLLQVDVFVVLLCRTWTFSSLIAQNSNGVHQALMITQTALWQEGRQVLNSEQMVIMVPFD
jgi:hypothetical protein